MIFLGCSELQGNKFKPSDFNFEFYDLECTTLWSVEIEIIFYENKINSKRMSISLMLWQRLCLKRVTAAVDINSKQSAKESMMLHGQLYM